MQWIAGFIEITAQIRDQKLRRLPQETVQAVAH
jgi:hypothetical protein